MKAKKLYRVDRSPLHGKGLIAAKKIAEGTVLGRCKTKPARKAGLHTLSFDDGKQLNVTCDLKFINHGRPPNVAYYEDLTVEALRDIKPGEELLHDYGEEWD